MPLGDDILLLKRGLKAERKFLAEFQPWLQRNNSETSRSDNWKAVDFRVSNTGAGVELKTDFYERPVIMYLERWTTESRDDPAGPWKAR